MPTAPLLDFDAVNLDRVLAGRPEIRAVIKQRGRFEMLDGIAHMDHGENGLVVGFIDVTADAWWACDHIPGRPLFPGALMVEAAAQMCTFDFLQRQPEMTSKFLGFAGIDGVRYRGAVEPECRFYLAGRPARVRRTMFSYRTEGYVDRRLVYEGEILGMVV